MSSCDPRSSIIDVRRQAFIALILRYLGFWLIVPLFSYPYPQVTITHDVRTRLITMACACDDRELGEQSGPRAAAESRRTWLIGSCITSEHSKAKARANLRRLAGATGRRCLCECEKGPVINFGLDSALQTKMRCSQCQIARIYSTVPYCYTVAP